MAEHNPRAYFEVRVKKNAPSQRGIGLTDFGNMKRHLAITLGACAVSALAVLAFAQAPPVLRAPPKNEWAPRTQAHRLNGAARATDLIGMTVKNYQDEKLGTVEELAVDVESGRIVQVIVSIGGFVGIGDTLTAVPPGALHHDVAKKVLHLDANLEKLKRAPLFLTAKWAEHSDTAHLSLVYRYYGEASAFKLIQNGDSAPAVSPHSDASPAVASSELQALVPMSRLGLAQPATKLMGTVVKNLQDETLGKVENILLDMPSGRAVAMIISTGGFLGMGDELSAVPPAALTLNPGRDTLRLDASKEMLAAAPHFKANQWPDFDQPAYVGGVYRAYKVAPYFTADADNSGRNARDRYGRTLTPFDQGNGQVDLDTTAQIRMAIMTGKGMSLNAKNVKIITDQGRVTLRGPVNTAEEKRLIGEIADRIARAGQVDNQLEVKLSGK
jgi:hyperosmotically inducible protein